MWGNIDFKNAVLKKEENKHKYKQKNILQTAGINHAMRWNITQYKVLDWSNTTGS